MTDNTFLKKLSRTFFAGLVACLFIGAATNAAHAACATNEIDVLGDGTQCEESKFEITTTNDTNEFIFSMATSGTFYVDWGDGVVDVITSSDRNETEYSHSYSGTASYVIRFGGVATAYTPGGYQVSTIKFYKETGGTQDKIAELRGSLGKLFPRRVNYRSTFQNATNLTSIPSTLFNGHDVNVENYGFAGCFSGCTSLTSIPGDLFHDFDVLPNGSFGSTFENCSSLTQIPADLFSGISTTVWSYGMFSRTFKNCTSLTDIPSGLFDDINAGSTSWTQAQSMFLETFYGTKITSIPAGLFSNISMVNASNVDGMFLRTFAKCESLQSLPNGLFANLDVGNNTNARSLFSETFMDCTSLQSLGTGLFDGIDITGAYNTENMFSGTFSNTNISAIPNGLFNSIDTSNSTNTSNMFNSTFNNTSISAIPNGLFNSIDTSNSTDTSYMFRSTFNNTNISAIPNSLFNSIDTSNSTNTNGMFNSTFNNTNISAIPNGLFNSIDTSNSTDTNNMFNSTFKNTSISAIPNGLFNSIDTSNSTNTSSMFKNTFNSTRVSTIPTGLFDNIDTSNATNTNNMFHSTFNETQVSTIPTGLFDNIDTSNSTDTSYMFYSTFKNTQITSIPAGMFSGIDTSSATNTNNMFYYTFANCTSLTGYIPPTAFPNTITPGSSSSTDMWYHTFSGTQLATTCPAGTTEYNTGFENDWGYSKGNTTTSGTYRVSCEPCPNSLPENATWTVNTCNWTCDNGYTANNNICAVTVCTGATYYDITYPSGCAPCPDEYDYNTESGKTSISQCQIQCPAGTYAGSGNPDYNILEYIETTGTQYINTGILVSSLTNPILSTTMQYTASGVNQQNGAQISGMILKFGFPAKSTSYFMIMAGGSGTETKFDGADLNKHTWVINTQNQTCSLDDVTKPLNVGDISTINSVITIGALSRDATGTNINNKSKARYYNVNIVSDGAVIMNLVPAQRKSDNALGMLDTTNNQFYTNAGTGNFSAGSSIDGAGGGCIDAGTGYWASGGVANYGSKGTRTACTDVGDGSYTNSDVGAAANTDCYKTCTVAVANIAHALTVNGNDYYGGANTCSVATCENGYHVDNNACTANTITVNWSNASAADIDANEAGTVTYGGDIRTPRAAAIIPGKVFTGWTFSAPGE